MNKVILFLWFGDQKPPYIQWTLENFKKMNPRWEIRYIEYSTSQLKDYKNQNDQILIDTIPSADKFYFGGWTNNYRKQYLNLHKDEFIVYCDLDCFPIASFDNFILSENANVLQWIKNNHPNEFIFPRLMGNNWFRQNGYQELRPDIWCLCNNKAMLDRFIQLHKGSIIDDTLIIHNAMLMNENKIAQFEKRSKDFHEMKIELGDNFCLPQFTPIEHYYSFERNILNTEIKI